MKSLTQSLNAIGVLTVALTLALAANFAYGQWSNPPSSPPGGNVAAPINVGSDDQIKIGKLTANRLTASTQVRGNEVWATRYCDLSGNNCFTSDRVTQTPPPPPSFASCTSPRAEHMEIVRTTSGSRPPFSWYSSCRTTTTRQCRDGSYSTVSSSRSCTEREKMGGAGAGL
jgi:hypothetical protein